MNQIPVRTKNYDPTETRTIRLFVSSTFLDMKAERDELALRIFPQLRRLCESRGVAWTEIDLRWGITDEKAAEGQVLPICLNEIDRCHPFFIGILGERYGWIAPALPENLNRREPWLKNQIKQGKSITELEILHGVLNQPSLNNHAFFYFRDAQKKKRFRIIPKKWRKDPKLDRLKMDIEAASEKKFCKLRKEKFQDAKQLGQWVLEDFTALINELYPEQDKLDDAARIRMDQWAAARNKTDVYIDRQAYYDRLDQFVASDDSELSPLVVLGRPGCGKSALLANWAIQYQVKKPDDFFLLHLLGVSDESSDHIELLRRIVLELKSAFGLTETIPADPASLVAGFPEWLEKVAGRRKIILVLDALNQVEDNDNASQLSWLPRELPKGVRLIVSTLPGPSLEAIKARKWMGQTPPLTIQSLEGKEKHQLIHQYLKDSGRELNDKRLHQIVAAKQTANPLFLRAMLDELRLMGEHERLDKQINDYLKALDPKALYIKIIERWIQVYSEDRDLVARSLRLLWAARNGLSETELLGILGEGDKPLPRAYLTPFLVAAAPAMVNQSERLVPGHEFIRSAIADLLCQDKDVLRQVRLSIADYLIGGMHLPGRVLAERPWQLAHGGYLSELKQFLLSPLMLRMIKSPRALQEARHYWFLFKNTDSVGQEIRSAFEEMIRVKPEPASEGKIANALSVLLSDLGYSAESLWFVKLSEKYYQNNVSVFPEEQITIQNNRAAVLIKAGRLQQAKDMLEELLAKVSDQGMLDADPSLSASSNLAQILHLTGNLEQALERYRDIARRTARKYGKYHPDYVKRHANEICLALEVNPDKVQEADIRASIQSAREAFGSGHETTHASMHNLGGYYERKNMLDQAYQHFSEMLVASETQNGKDAYPTLRIMLSCARVKFKMEDYAGADLLFSECFSRSCQRLGPLNSASLECLIGWSATSLHHEDSELLIEPFKTVLGAFWSYYFEFRTKHVQHEEYEELFTKYLLIKKVPQKDLLRHYETILEEAKNKNQ